MNHSLVRDALSLAADPRAAVGDAALHRLRNA